MKAWIEAVLSVGSALGGLGYGAVAWRISAQHRLALLATGLVVILIPAALSPNLLVPLLRARLTPTAEQPVAPGGSAGDTVPPAEGGTLRNAHPSPWP